MQIVPTGNFGGQDLLTLSHIPVLVFPQSPWSSFLSCFLVPQGWCIALKCSGYEGEAGCLWSLLALHKHKHFCLPSWTPLPSGETTACFSFSRRCESRPVITGTPFPWMYFSWFKRFWIFKRETWDFFLNLLYFMWAEEFSAYILYHQGLEHEWLLLYPVLHIQLCSFFSNEVTMPMRKLLPTYKTNSKFAKPEYKAELNSCSFPGFMRDESCT